jgi:hypothetical protein
MRGEREGKQEEEQVCVVQTRDDAVQKDGGRPFLIPFHAAFQKAIAQEVLTTSVTLGRQPVAHHDAMCTSPLVTWKLSKSVSGWYRGSLNSKSKNYLGRLSPTFLPLSFLYTS